VTVIAGWVARNVGRVLAGGNDAVVTGAATPNYLCVIDAACRRPYRRTVAVFANIGRQNVCRVLTSGLRAVMAADAIAKDVHMSKICRQPRHRSVAVIAGSAACYVSRVFAGRSNAVVAANAIAEDVAVIEDCRCPGYGIVTIVALIAGGDVTRCFSGRPNTVVACVAASDHRRVIHKRDYRPGGRDVTVGALLR